MRSGKPRRMLAIWAARGAVGSVFAWNMTAALAFLIRPERYTAGFELSGAVGEAIVRGFGVLFLMWNATYPPVILRPQPHRPLFLIILIQQALALAGEGWIWLTLTPEHSALWQTGLRFILFDGIGLVAMTMGFVWLNRAGGVEAAG